MTRSEWEARRCSNEFFPPWEVATWKERATKLACWVSAVPVTIFGFFLVVTVVGMMIEGVAQRMDDHDRCMKQATNGYEIERCR